MERADHFSPQDHSRWCRQKLRHPGRPPCRFTQRNSRSRKRNSRSFGKFWPRGGGTKAARQEIGETDAGIAKAAAGFVIVRERSGAELRLSSRAGSRMHLLCDKLLASMAVKTEKELSESLRALWLKAVSAIELRNFGYAISLLQEILKLEPEFLTGRQLLRRAEVTKSKSAKKSFFKISTAPIGAMKAQREIKKDPKRAVEMLEEILEGEPYNRQANLLLKEAAIAAGWSEIAVFALRTLLEANPRDVKVLNELGRLYHELGDHENEVEIYNQITAINPLDAQSLRLSKDASARASMKRGGWTQAESYRDLIKDKDEAISLEQQSRIRLTGEALDQQIAETYARHKAEPENLDVARRLGALSEQKDDFESAIRRYQYAADLTKSADTGLLRKISDLKIKCLEREITAHEEFLAAYTARDEVFAEKSEQLRV